MGINLNKRAIQHCLPRIQPAMDQSLHPTLAGTWADHGGESVEKGTPTTVFNLSSSDTSTDISSSPSTCSSFSGDKLCGEGEGAANHRVSLAGKVSN